MNEDSLVSFENLVKYCQVELVEHLYCVIE